MSLWKPDSDRDDTVQEDGVSNEGNTFPGIPENEIRIVLIGKTGCGKSATGNSIVGRKAFVSKGGFVSVTKKCERCEEERFGIRISIVDTPGFFDTNMEKNVIQQELYNCIGKSAPGPHAFLIVVKLERLTDEARNAIEELERLFGEHFFKYSLVLFTRKEDVEDDQTIEEYIENVDGYLKELLEKCGNRYIAFNNRAVKEEKDKDVKHLLEKIEQVVQENEGSFYTNKIWEQAEQETERMIQQSMEKEQENNKNFQQYESRIKELEEEKAKLVTTSQEEKEKNEKELQTISEDKEKIEREKKKDFRTKVRDKNINWKNVLKTTIQVATFVGVIAISRKTK